MFHVKHFCSTGGRILFHVKQGIVACEANEICADAARAHKGGHQGFHPCESRFLLGGHGENRRAATAAKRERQSGYSCVSFANYPQFTDNVLLHISAILRRRDMTVSREHFACCCGQHFWVKLEKVGERVAHIYNKVREPAGSLLFHVKQKSMNLPVVSCETAKYLMFHVKQL